MKKLVYILPLMVLLAACGKPNGPVGPDDDQPEYMDSTQHSDMVVYLGVMPLTHDTAFVVNEYEPSLSGADEMGISGKIEGVKGFRVEVTRSAEGLKDELCAGVQCVPGDGETKQDFDYTLMGGATTASWYSHYTPAKAGDAIITYRFRNFDRSVKLTVTYRYAK